MMVGNALLDRCPADVLHRGVSALNFDIESSPSISDLIIILLRNQIINQPMGITASRTIPSANQNLRNDYLPLILHLQPEKQETIGLRCILLLLLHLHLSSTSAASRNAQPIRSSPDQKSPAQHIKFHSICMAEYSKAVYF